MTKMQNRKTGTKTLFLSDLHIESDKGPIMDSLMRILQNDAQGADAIYFLGDVFEAWIGDDDDCPAADKMAAVLKALSEKGTGIYFMHGNRDFLLGNEFASRCGGKLIPDPTVVDLYGQRVVLLHGDSLCTRDSAYMQFRQQVRDPAWQQAFLARPLLERMMVAQQLRQQSQEANSNKASDIMDVTHEEVIKSLIKHDVNLMIHGHTHRPGIHTIRLPQEVNGSTEAHRIVLGAWDQKAWILEFRPDGYDLKPVAHQAG